MEYRVEQLATLWVATYVEAESVDEALELAYDKFDNSEYEEVDGSWERQDKYWIRDEEGRNYER
jgi:hypothetical protein